MGLRQKDPYCLREVILTSTSYAREEKRVTDVSSTCFYKLDLNQLGKHLSQLTLYICRSLC